MALWQSQMEDHTSDWLRVVPIYGLGQTMNVFTGDIYGDHVVSYAGIIGIKHRHNVVRDTLVDIWSSPLTQTGMVDFVPGRALIDAAHRKRVKYEAKSDLSVTDGANAKSSGILTNVESSGDGVTSRVPLPGVGDLSAWVQLHILPCRVLSTFVPTNKAQLRSVERDRCQFESISLVIQRWRDPVDRLGLVVDRLAEATPSFSRMKKSKNFDKVNTFQCKRKVVDGHFTIAIKVLTSFGVNPSTLDTLNDLEAKHPFASPSALSSSPLGRDVLSVHKDFMMNRIYSFPIGTSWVVDLLLSQKCPSQVGDFIASAPLCPLVKPGGGLRPIAVGTVWRRLLYKAVLHSVNRLTEDKGNKVGISMLQVDSKNSFNLVDKNVLLQETRA
ncbi:hypothetical protein Tco_0807627 [Tanacetum coccineum]